MNTSDAGVVVFFADPNIPLHYAMGAAVFFIFALILHRRMIERTGRNSYFVMQAIVLLIGTASYYLSMRERTNPAIAVKLSPQGMWCAQYSFLLAQESFLLKWEEITRLDLRYVSGRASTHAYVYIYLDPQYIVRHPWREDARENMRAKCRIDDLNQSPYAVVATMQQYRQAALAKPAAVSEVIH